MNSMRTKAPSVGFADISPVNGGVPVAFRADAGRIVPREAGEGDHAKHGGGGVAPTLVTVP
jgi:hypothetical protein